MAARGLTVPLCCWCFERIEDEKVWRAYAVRSPALYCSRRCRVNAKSARGWSNRTGRVSPKLARHLAALATRSDERTATRDTVPAECADAVVAAMSRADTIALLRAALRRLTDDDALLFAQPADREAYVYDRAVPRDERDEAAVTVHLRAAG